MPLLLPDDKVVFGVILFSFDGKSQPPTHKNQVELFWNDLRSLERRNFLLRWLQATIWEEIRLAGGAPLNLKSELDVFINRLREAYKLSSWPQPDMIYVQIVDHDQQTIRTVRGFGMPLSFEYIPAHTLDSDDIQSSVVRTRLPECIVGFDKRFDQRIFDQYEHEKYSRFWFPLFPLPMNMKGEDGTMEKYLRESLFWRVEVAVERSKKMKADWVGEAAPPPGLVFGTVEIGYYRKNLSEFKLEPWGQKHATWAMARGCILGDRLFPVTHAGALDRMGWALTLLAPERRLRFRYAAAHGRIVETRHYPASRPWRTAVPEREVQLENEHILNGEVIPDWEEQSLLLLEQEHPPQSDRAGIRVEAIRRTKRAAEVALHLFRGAVYPQELMVPDRSPIAMGVEVDDTTVKAICAEAVQMTSASRCLAFFFELRKEDKKHPIWRIRPATDYMPPNMSTNMSEYHTSGMPDDFVSRVEPGARAIVSRNIASYDSTLAVGSVKYSLVLLPLELSKAVVGVLVLCFPPGRRFRDSAKADLERRIPRWVYRVLILDLISHNRFSALTATIRENIKKAHEKACGTPPRLDCVQAFIEEVLYLNSKSVNPSAAWLTICEQTPGGSTILERYWCTGRPPDEIQVQRYRFSPAEPAELSGPCKEACDSGDTVIFSGKTKKEKLKKLIATLQDEAKNRKVQNDQETAEQLLKFVHAIEPDNSPTTIITFPVVRGGEKKGLSRAAYTWVLEGDLYFDAEHRRLLEELGVVLADTLQQVRQAGRRRQEDEFHASLERFGQELAEKYSFDDSFGAFLGLLSGRFDTKLAEDIVFWLLSADRSQLVARSGRGTVWHPLIKKGLDVLDASKHPSQGFFLTRQDIMVDSPFFLVSPLVGPESSIPGIYRREANPNRKWYLSFPMVNAAGDVYGVADCLLDLPLTIVEEDVLRGVLTRASVQFFSKLTELRYCLTGEITNQLFTKTEECLREFRTDAAYDEIVRQISDFFNCEYCDLFLERTGDVLLYATTREAGPKNDTERFRFSLRKEPARELFALCLQQRTPELQHRLDPKSVIDSSHFSVDLQKLLAGSLRAERLAVPLRNGTDDTSAVVGILHIETPKKRWKDANCPDAPTLLKRSLRFTEEEFQLANDLAPPLQRILRTVQLVEQQGWLVRDLGHSLGHPLQALRSAVSNIRRSLAEEKKVDYLKRKEMNDEVEYAFRIVADARDRWGFFTTPRQQGHKYNFKEVRLKDFIKNCCDFLTPAAALGRNRITYPNLQELDPVPVEDAWLRIAIINLLENACKYSWFKRNVVVSLTESGRGQITITIRNWGIGIPKKDIVNIFKPYYRSRVPDARGTRPGSGIGLAIVRIAIEEILGGKVSVESHPDRENQVATDDGPGGIRNKEFETTFTIRLDRTRLNSLAQHDHILERREI